MSHQKAAFPIWTSFEMAKTTTEKGQILSAADGPIFTSTSGILQTHPQRNTHSH